MFHALLLAAGCQAPAPPDAAPASLEKSCPSPRLLAPLSTSRVTRDEPELSWDPCTTQSRVEICADRECLTVLERSDTSQTVFTPQRPRGGQEVIFWRVGALSRGVVNAWSHVWEVVLPDGDSTVETAGASVLDVDLDGLANFAVGAPEQQAGGVLTAGQVHVYSEAPDPDQTLAQPTPQSLSAFGGSLASAGDLNGDGFADLIVGANNALDDDDDATGAAYVFLGSAAGLGAVPVTAFGPEVGSAFGFSVSSAGDYNADGYADIVVGAPAYGPTQTGAAYVYYGSATPDLTTPAYTILGAGAAGSEFGVNVAGVGDLTGDGYSDVAVGETYFAFWQGDYPPGRVSIRPGGKQPELLKGVMVYSPDSENSDGFGYSISEAADLNGDGYHDLVVGASGTNNNDGAVYVWYGGPTYVGYADGPDLVIEPPVAGQGTFFGWSVSASGDIDADGLDDLVIGETDADGFDGRVYVLRSTDGVLTQLDNPDPVAAGYFGYGAQLVGDTDGDGHDEFLAGAYGAAWLFPGGALPPVEADGLELGPVGGLFGIVGM
jgi:hypothetical protein